jgi:hypothetical protein
VFGEARVRFAARKNTVYMHVHVLDDQRRGAWRYARRGEPPR